MSDENTGAGAAGGTGGPDELTTKLLGLKRTIASNADLQAELKDAGTHDEFHHKLVAIGARHGVQFTPDQGKAFLSRRAQLVRSAEPPPPPQTSSNCGGGYTHESSNWCTWNPFKC